MDLAAHAASVTMPAWVQILSYLAVCGLLLWTQANTTRHASLREDRIMAESAAREATYLEAILHGHNGGPGIDSLVQAVERSAQEAKLAAAAAKDAAEHAAVAAMHFAEFSEFRQELAEIRHLVETLACQPAGTCPAAAMPIRPRGVHL